MSMDFTNKSCTVSYYFGRSRISVTSTKRGRERRKNWGDSKEGRKERTGVEITNTEFDFIY